MIRFAVFALMALAAAALVAFGSAERPGAVASDEPSSAPRSRSHDPSGSSALMLSRNAQGQFHVAAEVNGESVRFLVDTGADLVALTVEDAARLGLGIDPGGFEAVGESASGTAYGTLVTLDSLTVAGTEFRDVQAVVLDGLGTNLLGQSILRRLGRMELSGDRMVIQPTD